MFNEKIYKSEEHRNINMYPGDPKGSPDESFSDTLIFVDSAFVEKLNKYFGHGKYLKFDRCPFFKNLAKKENLNCKEIFYYIAAPFQSDRPTEDEERRRDGYDNFVNSIKGRGIIVREGRCQRVKIDGKFEFNQKAVDILLTMDLMNVPLRYPNVKRIILVSSDSDFVPVVKSVYENGVKTILYTYYEKKRDTAFSVSNHLVQSVYKYVLLAKEDFLEVKDE